MAERGAAWAATIDTGTSNTRVRVWQGPQVRGSAGRPVGVRDTVRTGSRAALQQAVREALQEAAAEAGVAIDLLNAVVASGMITSASGLHEVPHLAAPAGLAELAAGMTRRLLPEVCALPIWFVPGVRSSVLPTGLEDVEAFDLMRGEETEAVALAQRLQLSAPARLMLPGSHCKIVQLDAAQRICGSATTMSGELLEVLQTQTLLAGSISSAFADTLDCAALEAGADAAGRVGLARAAFGVRLLDLRNLAERNARACYLMGAVLAGDVLALHESSALSADTGAGAGAGADELWVAGRPLMRDALVHLLRRSRPGRDVGIGAAGPGIRVHAISDLDQADLAGWGACLLARQRSLLSA